MSATGTVSLQVHMSNMDKGATQGAEAVRKKIDEVGKAGGTAGKQTDGLADKIKGLSGAGQGLTQVGNAIKGFFALEVVNLGITYLSKAIDKIKELREEAAFSDRFDKLAGSARAGSAALKDLETQTGLEGKAASQAGIEWLRAGGSLSELREATVQANAMFALFGDGQADTLKKLTDARKEGVVPYHEALEKLRDETTKVNGTIQTLAESIAARFSHGSMAEADRVLAALAGRFWNVRTAAESAGDAMAVAAQAAIAKGVRGIQEATFTAENRAALAAKKTQDELDDAAGLGKNPDGSRFQPVEWKRSGGGGGGKKPGAGKQDNWDGAKELRNFGLQMREIREEDERKAFRESEEKGNEAARALHDAVASAKLYKPLIEDMRAAGDAVDYLAESLGRMSEIAPGFGEAADAISKGLKGFAEALDASDTQAGVDAIAGTMTGITAALKVGRAEQAAIEILAETAMGIAAAFTPGAQLVAAGHFAAAAAWGAVLAQTSGGGGAGRASGPNAMSSTWGSGNRRQESDRAQANAGPVTVNVQGSVLGTAQQVGQAVARGLREAGRGGMASGARA